MTQSKTSPGPRRPESDAPRSGARLTEAGSRRARMRASGTRERLATVKIRPWSQLPGVIAYLVVDPGGLVMDRWGEPSPIQEERAAAFRARARQGQIEGSYLLEGCGEQRLLSVLRRDGWFVHVWLEGPSDVAGILGVIGA